MDLISLQQHMPDRYRGCAAAIGNFDGVHRGHQAVLNGLVASARVLGATTLVMTFEPLPREFFGQPCARLTRFRERLQILSQLPLDHALCLRFGRWLAEMPAEHFVRELLVGRLGIRHLVVGDDFRFGKDRTGDFALLCREGERHGFSVASTPSFLIDGERVSSTRVREALKQGDVQQAERLLGRPYSVSGRVRHGEQRGRTIGFPTANLGFGRRPPPVSGVYAVGVITADGVQRTGVANAGVRPTVNGREFRLETHVFDFDGDLYGQRIEIQFLHRLREERRFESFDALRQQIAEDSRQARYYFSTHRTH